ncbi:MAG: type II toxin-antitoxin system Phd/YefM family antitoxin [Gammaproteobacteria bacterium]|nr:type II toxin-antitoxin system Phd/YefM family antitoxin [Gammaproteobacteria bacterium]
MLKQEIGAFEAKTYFSKLLLEVALGKEIIITKHHHKVAKLIPFQKKGGTVVETIAAIRNLRKGITLGKKLNIKAMKEMGRK